jgi:hypothetical protein
MPEQEQPSKRPAVVLWPVVRWSCRWALGCRWAEQLNKFDKFYKYRQQAASSS